MAGWTFALLEAALAKTNQISDDKRTAFQARLKNLHRLELTFPTGFSAVKGRAACYTGRQVCEMTLAVELAQLGVPPDRTVKLCVFHAEILKTAFQSAIEALLGEDRFPHVVMFDPSGLADLQDRHPEEISAGVDGAVLTFETMTANNLSEQFENWQQGYFRRAAMINLTDTLREVTYRLAEMTKSHEGEVRFAILEELRGGKAVASGNP